MNAHGQNDRYGIEEEKTNEWNTQKYWQCTTEPMGQTKKTSTKQKLKGEKLGETHFLLLFKTAISDPFVCVCVCVCMRSTFARNREMLPTFHVASSSSSSDRCAITALLKEGNNNYQAKHPKDKTSTLTENPSRGYQLWNNRQKQHTKNSYRIHRSSARRTLRQLCCRYLF